MADAFVIPCTEAPKRPFWKSRPNYDLEYAGGAYKRHVELDFESIPEYPHDKAQWMSSQTQFQLPMIVEPVSPFSMSSALPLFKQASYKDAKSVNEPESSNASISQSEQSHTAPEGPLYPLGGARRYGDLPPLPVIPERSSSGRLSAAEPSGASGAIGKSLQAEARALYPNTQDGEMSRSNSGIPPVLTGPDSGSSTHSGVTSDSAPRTPPPIEKGFFGDAISRTQAEDYLAQPDGIDHEVFPAPPHSYMSSPSTLYLRDSWGQFILDAQSHYVSASGSVHGAELRSNKPPSTIEEREEKWTGEVPNVWSLFSQSPTSGLMDLPPSPVPAPPHNTLSVNPIFAHILWDVRFPPASASLIMPKFRKGKYSSELWSDDEGSTRALARVEVMAPATYPPTPILLISSSHTRWRARVEGEGAEDGPKAYVTVADVMFALHEQLSLRFVKQSEWDKLNERTKWYVGRAYGRNRLGDMSDAGSVSSGFSGSAGGGGQSMHGSIWSEGSRMSGESIGCGPGTEWGPGIRRADVLRDRTMFAGLKFDPSYKRRARGEEGMFHLVMDLRRHEPEIDTASGVLV